MRAGRTIALAAALAAVALGTHRAAGDEADEALTSWQPKVDVAVDRGLEFLAHSQTDNGALPDRKSATAVTGLSVMAFLAKGHTPGDGPYGETIDRGIDYVLTQQAGSGMFGKEMYTHSIATLLLSEVSGMVDDQRQEKIDQSLAKALSVILRAQKVTKPPAHQGGWRYGPTSADSDISCTGWALMALRSAKNNGAQIPAASMEQAVAFLLRCRTADGGFAYQPGREPGPARTGVGLLCLELAGRHRGQETIAAGDWLLKHQRKSVAWGGSHFYYGLYYAAQGMFQLGGRHWPLYAETIYQAAMKFQRADGSWPAEAGGKTTGSQYATAMTILALSVTYRQLPIYQR